VRRREGEGWARLRVSLKVDGHEGPVLEADHDETGLAIYFYCRRCRRVHRFAEEEDWEGEQLVRRLEDADPSLYFEGKLVERAKAMGYEVAEGPPALRAEERKGLDEV
jgi:hypothetical protein